MVLGLWDARNKILHGATLEEETYSEKAGN